MLDMYGMVRIGNQQLAQLMIRPWREISRKWGFLEFTKKSISVQK